MKRLLIANRGEIASRIIRSCRAMGLESIAVYSEADRDSPHVSEADHAVCIGAAPPEQSYMNVDKLLAVARDAAADAIHPGYGFLSENPHFARAVMDAGISWVGPGLEAMEKMASKISAREIALANEVPVLPAVIVSAEETLECSRIEQEVGTPLLIKAAAGGGGIGMREVHEPGELEKELDEARNQALRQFGSGDLLVERLLQGGRHVEVQVMGDKHGKLLHFHDRDCSAQRRRQKLLEEAPAPGLTDDMRSRLHSAALRLAKAVDYQGAGTVEFLVEGDEFFLLEMNTRLQVEHGVTEEVCAVDLVELQIRVARGEALALEQTDISCQGHAIQARVYAEQPEQNFVPSSGRVSAIDPAAVTDTRLDSGIGPGMEIGHHYDGLLCKLIVHGADRAEASEKLSTALAGLRLSGIATNQAFLAAVLRSDHWKQVLSTGELEAKLGELLELTKPNHTAQQQLLCAATLYRFLKQPPAADRVAWPGAYHLHRNSHWRHLGEDLEVNWRWTGANSFEFPEWHINATVLDTEGDGLLVECNGQRLHFHCQCDGDLINLWQQQLGNHQLESLPAGTGDQAGTDASQCRAPGPGQILQVLVTAGDTVTPGTPLLVLESMKMETTLTATGSGSVGRIEIEPGDLVSSGQVLVSFEPTLETNG